MFGVLVVVLCPDRVADLGFSAGERQVSLIVSLRGLRSLRLGAGGTRCPLLRACNKWRRPSGLACIHDWFWAILRDSLLGSAAKAPRDTRQNTRDRACIL
jgi:hypothetical protein